MHCPKCNAHETRVIDSRVGKTAFSIRRRRQCLNCDHRFTTLEEILREDLFVIKRDQRREPFDRSKLFNGIQRAFEKRPVDIEQMGMLIGDLMVELEDKFDYEIPTKAIGERIMAKLKSIDQIAYVRFASVYKGFRDISQMAQEISQLKQPHE